MGQKRVSHGVVALSRVACAPVILCWRRRTRIILRWASSVREWAGIGIARFGNAVLVLVDPFCWDVAVVQLEPRTTFPFFLG